MIIYISVLVKFTVPVMKGHDHSKLGRKGFIGPIVSHYNP